MSKYSDVTGTIKQIDPVQETNECQVIFIPTIQQHKNSYNRWVYAYSKYLNQLHYELQQEFNLQIQSEILFQVLYEKSSGEISKYI